MKVNLKEVLVILSCALILGIVYNFSQPKPLSLIYKKKKLAQLSDDVLFGSKDVHSKDIELDGEETVTYEQMLKLVDNDEFMIIDARSEDFYNNQHIGNAINIFPYDDEAVVMNKVLDLPQDKKIIVYCDGGACDSSHKIAEILISFGLEAYIYSGGWEEWAKKQGLEE
ncbi:MAG: rhodanese-like domain-containing protein [Candidatus Kapaibacterium sp.]|jgi:rhodanese-related sulfurtransferase|nr:rhodanese-like domain-containing protein [Candidatus Kapabacteria bacterium]